MRQNLVVLFFRRFFKFLKKENKELYLSLEMRRPQNLEDREQLKKLHLIP